ncbi:hypothetical protein BDP27DRAFT_318035 [Rhodocollybia butyracea]|uniref:Uncharacterized protein n=1 Tax=Rhodocollybia butyracea TaxID=206335 RepID=A0A9P5PVK0_9AGAR|nr:hypothetical protein BDP27DRAFT_318035 [Rhodocollybia butyracea]
MIDSTPTPPPPSSSNTTASTTGGPQSAILALLTQAANAGASSNQPSTSNPLDVSQLALLQQLTQTAQMGTNVSYPNAGTAPAQSVPPDVNAVRSFYADVSSSRSPSNNRYSSPDGDYRHDSRGAYRGGRGGRGKRDGHFRDREQPSRSKSPQSRYGARREIKPYSPTRRPIVSPREPFDAGKPFQATAEAKNKDEFGRELRAQSTESSEDADSPVGTSRVQQTHTHPTSPPGPRALSQPDLAGQASPGNEQFNMATFDFTDPTAWVTLGKMYEASFGVMPSTEQLMQFVMMAGASMDLSYDSWNQSGNTYMDAQGISTLGGGIQDYSGNHFQGQSSVNGGWNAGGGDPRVQRGGLSETVAGATTESPVAKRGGGMRKVGDKWVFVRETDSGYRDSFRHDFGVTSLSILYHILVFMPFRRFDERIAILLLYRLDCFWPNVGTG